MRRSVLALALGVAVATPLAAQQRGAWEFGGFGRYNWYDGSFNVADDTKEKNSFGFGGRAGWFVARNLALELDGSLNPTDVDNPGGAQSVTLKYIPFHLRLIYNAPLGERFRFLVGAGANYNRYHVGDEADDFLDSRFMGDDWGVGALAGFRAQLLDWLSLRVDGTGDFIPSPHNDPDGSNKMWGVQAGLSIHLGTACRGRLDSIRVEPRSATINVGETVVFRVIGTLCEGATTDVGAGTRATVEGAATMTALTFSSGTPGTYQVRFENPQARRKRVDTATVTVRQPPPPPPPAPTVTRVDLQPDSVTIFVNEGVTFRVVGILSDNTTRDMTDCQLTADGGTITGGRFTSPTPGGFTVTAQCPGGMTDRSRITVRPLDITITALFRFDETNVGDSLRAELDELRNFARVLRENPSLMIVMTGHADFIGTDAYNCNLGWRRIRAVVDTLRSFGAPQNVLDQISKTSYGERQPVDPGQSDVARARNRRVEISDQTSARQYERNRACRPESP